MMFSIKKFIKIGLLTAFSLGCFTVAQGRQEFFPVSEVQEGMHGIARTVVHGRQIDTFDVDVLGVLKNKGATGGDLVLVKVSGPVIDQTNGIAQGMSGSPVYINGKLLGAVAYGFPQSGGRIGMVTPISDMLNLWTLDNTGTENLRKDENLIPLETPIMASGYSPEGLDFLTRKMKGFHLVPYSTASAGADEVAYPLEAGSAVSATLVTGDLKLGAIGTVTYVDGDHVVAFGHPFLNRGAAGYFMHNSYIFTVVPSQNIPFKMGSIGREIGEINQDRGAGISGISGKIPESVRLHVSVRDEDTGNDKSLNVRMIPDEKLLPMLAATSIYNAVNSTLDRKGAGTVAFSYTLWPENLKDKAFHRTNMYWSDSDIAERSVDEIYNVIRIFSQNRFKKYPLRDMTVDVNVTEAKKTAQLLDASAYPVVVSPGDTIYIRARIQPYRGEIFYKDLTFKVPEDQSYGDMMLEIRGGGVIPLPYLIQQQRYNLTGEVLERLRVYKDFDDLFEKLEKEDQNNQIVAEIINPEVSMISKEGEEKQRAEIKDKKSSDVPDYLKEQGNEPVKKERETPKSAVSTDYVILGDGQFNFKVMPPAERDAALKQLSDSKQKALIEMTNKEKNEMEDKEKSKSEENQSAETGTLIAY